MIIKNMFTKIVVKKLNLDPFDHALNLESLGVGEILLNSIDNDGMMEGFDYKFIKKISDALKVPLIASGALVTLCI